MMDDDNSAYTLVRNAFMAFQPKEDALRHCADKWNNEILYHGDRKFSLNDEGDWGWSWFTYERGGPEEPWEFISCGVNTLDERPVMEEVLRNWLEEGK